MKTSLLTALCGMLIVGTTSCTGQSLPRSAFQKNYTIEITVIDADTGLRIPEAKIQTNFDNGKTFGVTDKFGRASFHGRVIYGASVDVRKKGWFFAILSG